MNRVDVRPELLRWAYQRAGKSIRSLQKTISKIDFLGKRPN